MLAALFLSASALCPVTVGAQAPAAPATAEQPGAVVRQVVMRDAATAEQFRLKLESMKANGLFRDQIVALDPKKPIQVEISFLTSGNYLLVIGSRRWVDDNIEAIRLMGFLFDRPRAHLQLNLRVVQITGTANGDVIQMAETVRALVDGQREEIVRTFADLQEQLQSRFDRRTVRERQVFLAARQLLPSLGSPERPLGVPEVLLLIMLDRCSPGPSGPPPTEREMERQESQFAFIALSRAVELALADPRSEDAAALRTLRSELALWRKALTAARDWTAHYGQLVRKDRSREAAAALVELRQALSSEENPLPAWLGRRVSRSLELTERLHPALLRRHAESLLEELTRRFERALARSAELEATIFEGGAQGENAGRGRGRRAEPAPATLPALSPVRRSLVALKTLAEELVPAPLALFQAVTESAGNGAPTADQLIQMFRDYAAERRRLEQRLRDQDRPGDAPVNYSKVQALEAGLNLWLRRVSEAMGRSLEQQFYRRYVNELRLLANRQLGRSSSRDLLDETGLDEIPDVTRDIALNDGGVNLFLSNSVSLQFAPDTQNSVSAQVQAPLPAKTTVLERLQQAQQANTAINALGQQFGINGEGIIKSLLAGGQAVPVQGGISLSATPSIGFDAGTVSLTLTANQTLEPGNAKVTDRVTNHSINNATVTALSYEPMVLSTLASNVSYFENSGGIPILRKTPIVKDLLKDLPAPLRETRRQKGIYQSSVIILEPVVIPTIEDMVRFHAGWLDTSLMPPATGPLPDPDQ